MAANVPHYSLCVSAVSMAIPKKPLRFWTFSSDDEAARLVCRRYRYRGGIQPKPERWALVMLKKKGGTREKLPYTDSQDKYTRSAFCKRVGEVSRRAIIAILAIIQNGYFV